MKKLVFLLATLMFVFVFAVNATPGYAQGGTRLAETSVTIPAGEEVTIDYQAYCLDFGEPFPAAFGTPSERADDDILKVVKTAILDGTADEDPLSVNLAIWSLRENKTPVALYPNLDADIEERTNDLLERSQDQTVEPLADDLGIPLNQAVADGQVEVTDTDFKPDTDAPIADPADEGHPYHGSGTMTIRNLTDQDLDIYYAFGTVLQAADEGEQDLITYATELEQVATPTPAATATTAATATAAATATPKVVATATPQAPTTVPTTGTGDNALVLVLGGLVLMGAALGYQYIKVSRA